MNKLSEYILENVDIVDVISRRINLKRSGSNFAGLSPFQHEKTPSCMVSPQKQIFKDFSSGIGGNVITFVMEYEKVDYLDAVKIIADEQRIDISEFFSNSENEKKFTDDREKLKRIHKLAQNYFVESFQNSEKAKEYIYKNRELSEKIVSDFGIGYAPDSSFGLLQYLKTKGFSESDLVQASLAKKGQTDFFSFFKNRITFPIFDARGTIVGFSARVLESQDQSKYLNSSEQAIFEKSKILYGLNFAKKNIKNYDMIILLEGQMDVIGLAKLGFPIGVATCGTAVTEHHIKLLKRHTDNVYILFDNDEAGKNATLRALKIAYRENVFPKMIILPDGFKDADDLSKVEDGRQIFDACIKNAKDAFLQVYELLREKYDMSSPIDKQKLFNDMFSMISSVDNYAIQEHYKQLLSEKVGISYEVLAVQFNKYLKTDGKFEVVKHSKESEKPSWQPDREQICESLFFGELLTRYIEDVNLYRGLLELAKNIAQNLPQDFLYKIFYDNENINSEEKMQMDELQLWREKELEPLNSDEKRFFLIKNLILDYLQLKLKLILKSSSISVEIKQKLLADMRKI